MRTNVIGSVSMSVVSGQRMYDACHWWPVRNHGDEVTDIAIRATPFSLSLSLIPDGAAQVLGARRDWRELWFELPYEVREVRVPNVGDWADRAGRGR